MGRARSADACCRPARCASQVHGPVSQLPGYADGAWWVQDAAAALPARLLGDVRGRAVADLCAAPGGKTAQLAAAGAQVTAVDRSPPRLERLRQNLAGSASTAEIVAADAAEWRGGPVRRRPARRAVLRRPAPSAAIPTFPGSSARRDIAALAGAAAPAHCASALELTKPGGVARLLHLLARAGGRRSSRPRSPRPQSPDAAAPADRGWRGLRSGRVADAGGRPADAAVPLPDADSRMAGLDGFYAARLSQDIEGFIRGWPGSLPFAMFRPREWTNARQEGSHHLDVARFRRGTYQTVGVPGARRRAQAHQPRNDASVVNWPFSSARPTALVIAPQDLRTADATRAAKSMPAGSPSPARS